MTFDDVIAMLRKAGLVDMADRWSKWRTTMEPMLAPMLPAITAKATEKGLWSPPGGAAATFSAAEAAALPLLRDLDAALQSGGAEAAMTLWRQLVADPSSRSTLAGVAA